MEQAVEDLFRAFVEQDSSRAISVVEAARKQIPERQRLFDELFVPAMTRLGRAWLHAEIDELVFAQAAVVADQLTSFVVPRAAASDTGVTVLVGSVSGEHHSIGRNMTAAALKEAGHRVIDMGPDVSTAEFLEKVEETGARIVIACAETMATSQKVASVRALLDGGGHEGVVLLASGGPFDADPRLAREAGANGVVRGAENSIRVVGKVVSDLFGDAS